MAYKGVKGFFFDGRWYPPIAGAEDSGTGGDGASGTGEKSGGTGDGTGSDSKEQTNAGDKPIFTQAQLDAQIEARLRREREAAERKAEKDREAASDAAMKEQNQFKELADKHEKRAKELEPFKERAERLEAALKASLEGQRKGLAPHIIALLDRLDVVDQIEYIAENAEKLKADTGKQRTGVDATPTDTGTKTTDEIVAATRQDMQRSGAYAPL